LRDMNTTPQPNELREAIEELKKEFLDGIPTPPRPMAPFRWAGGKGKLARWIVQKFRYSVSVRGTWAFAAPMPCSLLPRVLPAM